MAATKTVSKLAQKYGAKLDSAVKSHANEKTISQGNIELPAGISNGILQVTKCYFKEYGKDTTQKTADGKSAAGEYYFRCEGTVVTPKSVDTPDGRMPIFGLPVPPVMIPFCDVKDSNGVITTQEQNIDKICKVMRSLGGEDYTQNATMNDLESLAAGLEAANPYCRFSSTQSKPTDKYPNPRVFVNWHSGKGLENFVPEDASATAMKDNTATQSSGQKQDKVTEPQVPDNTAKSSEENEYASWELEQLVDLANSDADTSQEGRDELNRRALEVGFTADEVEAATSWDALATSIQDRMSSGGESIGTSSPEAEPEPEPEVVPPKTGTTCKYTPPGNDPATKRPHKERACTIVKVDKEKKTAELKDLVTKKVHTGVKWEDMK